MLVLTRHPNERIMFPSLGITIHLLKLSAPAARVGIEAPREVPFLRDGLSSNLN
jgi:carbon storage regulator CsrA